MREIHSFAARRMTSAVFVALSVERIMNSLILNRRTQMKMNQFHPFRSDFARTENGNRQMKCETT